VVEADQVGSVQDLLRAPVFAELSPCLYDLW
jgi:hypothetical protein